jgi:hypothetical protein
MPCACRVQAVCKPCASRVQAVCMPSRCTISCTVYALWLAPRLEPWHARRRAPWCSARARPPAVHVQCSMQCIRTPTSSEAQVWVGVRVRGPSIVGVARTQASWALVLTGQLTCNESAPWMLVRCTKTSSLPSSGSVLAVEGGGVAPRRLTMRWGSVQRCGGAEAQRCNGAEWQRRRAH